MGTPMSKKFKVISRYNHSYLLLICTKHKYTVYTTMYFHQKYKLSNTNSSYQTTQWWNHAIRRRPAWVSNLELQPHQTPDPLWKTWTPPKTPDKEYRINWTQNNSDNSLTYVKTMKLHCHKQYNCTDLVCKSDEMMYWQKCKNPIFAQKFFVKITMHSALHTSTKYTKT